jgi:hypothetical protein
MTDDISRLLDGLRKYFERLENKKIPRPDNIFHHARYPHKFRLDEVLNELS